MQKILLKIANLFVVLAILVVILKPRTNAMEGVKNVVKNAFTRGNITESKTTAIAAGITLATIDQYLQIVPEQYREVVRAIAVIALFLWPHVN